MKSSNKSKPTASSFGKDQIMRKSSLLFMQFGLVFALLLTYLAIESKTLIDKDEVKYIPPTCELTVDIPDTTPNDPLPEPKPVKKVFAQNLVNLTIVDNDSLVRESPIETGVIDTLIPKPKIPALPEVILPEEDTPENFSAIKEAPVFPGCTGTKEEIKKCFSKSVNNLVQRKFNSGLAQELNLKPGKKRIAVQFTVDKTGEITDVKVRAPHKRLDKETRRVIGLLPKMNPGKKSGKPVGVKFTLPITFEVIE